jgi:hypothetical protein
MKALQNNEDRIEELINANKTILKEKLTLAMEIKVKDKLAEKKDKELFQNTNEIRTLTCKVIDLKEEHKIATAGLNAKVK